MNAGSVATQAPSESAQRREAWITGVELITLGAIWGASFLFQRVAAPAFGPLPLVLMRLGLGAIVLLPFLWQARALLARGELWRLAGIGLLNSAVPFVLFAWGAERAPAGIGAITNSLAVLFTAVFAFLIFGDRIGTRRALALLVGFVGVVVLASGRSAGLGVLEATIAGTLAALCYGISANLIRKHQTRLPPVALAAATLGTSTLLLAPFALATWPSTPISGTAWACAVAVGVLCTGLAYAIYFRLMKRVGITRAVTVTYITPLFGVAWGWLILGEPLTVSMAVAGALILGSVAFSQRSKPAPALAPAAPVVVAPSQECRAS